jgi:peptide/nickel transport system substrate-binding protein
MKKVFSITSLVLCIVFILTACSPQGSSNAEVGPTEVPQNEPAVQDTAPTTNEAPTVVMAANMSGLVTFDPLTMCEQLATMLFSLTYESLVNIDSSDYSKVIPYLAESWEISEDQRTYTMHINPKATFASGNPVTAEDVKWSLDRSRKDGATCYGSYLAPVESIDVVDDLTVNITTTSPDAAFLILLSTSGFATLEKAVAIQHGATDTLDQEDTAKDWLDQNSPGTGPYVLTKWEPNSEVVYEANPNWWGGTPSLGKFVVKHYEDPTLMVQQLQSGEADLIPWLDFDLIETVKADPNLKISASTDIVTTYMAMNMDPAISEYSSNKLVRQAIGAAINKDEIIQTILHGYGARAPSVVSVGELGVKPEDAAPRNLELARDLLSQAGYENGFTIPLYYSSTNPESALLATAVQSDLAEIGITVELKPTETSVLYTDIRASKTPFAISSWGPDTPDPTNLLDMFCYHDVVIGQWFNVNMPEAEPLCTQLHSEFDPAKRAELVQQITTIFNDYMPYIQFYNKDFVFATTQPVTGYYLPGRFMDLSKTTKD